MPLQKITHLGQWPAELFNYNAAPPMYIQNVLTSQIKIAKYIQDHPEVSIFAEDVYKNLNSPSEKNSFWAKKLFPTDIPKSIDELNIEQRKFLYEVGAVKVLYFLGSLNFIYKTISSSQKRVIKEYVHNQNWQTIFRLKEMVAIKHIHQELKKQPLQHVCLIFSDMYDFREQCEELGFEYKKTSFSPSFNQFMRKTGYYVKNTSKIKSSLIIRFLYPFVNPSLKRYKEKPLKVIHLGQVHPRRNRNLTDSHIKRVLNSQIKVAQYILKHPNTLVFVEGLAENYLSPASEEFQIRAKKLFPEGLPDNPNDLNLFQKYYLYTWRAVRVLFYLGLINSLFRTTTQIEKELVVKHVEAGEQNYIFGPREKIALNHIEEVTKRSPQKRVILVFGNAHDFSEECNLHLFAYEKISCL